MAIAQELSMITMHSIICNKSFCWFQNLEVGKFIFLCFEIFGMLHMATLASRGLPMMEDLQRTISIQVNLQIKLCSPATAPENSLDDPQV